VYINLAPDNFPEMQNLSCDESKHQTLTSSLEFYSKKIILYLTVIVWS